MTTIKAWGMAWWTAGIVLIGCGNDERAEISGAILALAGGVIVAAMIILDD